MTTLPASNEVSRATWSRSSRAFRARSLDDATYRLIGIYVEDEITFSDRYALIAGLRYNRAEADAKKVQAPLSGAQTHIKDDWSQFVGNLRLRAFLDNARTWQVFAGISQGFRAPNLSDLTRFDSARSNEFEVPSPNLDAEELVSYEVGVKFSGGGGGFGLSYFYSDINDLIVRTLTGRVVDGEVEITKRNAGGGYVTGVEIDGHAMPTANWLLWANFTWLDSAVETFPTSAPQLVREPIDREMRATPTGYHRGGTPGYFIFGVRGGWQAFDTIRLSLAVENLLDEEYRVHGSGLNGPGRNAIFAIEVAF